VQDVSTLRRHLAAHHKANSLTLVQGQILSWCDKHKYESKLEDDIKARAAAAAAESESQKQTTLDGHVHSGPPVDPVIPYSDSAFKSAAIEWLVATDQPIGAFEHPAFINMINIASRAKGAVTLPKRSATRQEILAQFHQYLRT
ncbi:uncharacterized protein B0H18DRAFT_890420, partial [Fomitopsis serialis]|uniref:uncharacterized protein n=1 Tax=Fomitopsis serialis TaxID=139415 RepID=UPI0020073659